MADQIRYDLLTQQALRGVVRNVLTDAAKKGLPGDHHFFITFDTQADGVRMSDRLRGQYPQEMTVILQHQFWDLSVSEQAFDVGLSFGGITERLSIPFDAIKAFVDPSVQFGLQFEEVVEGEAEQSPANPHDKAKEKLAAKPKRGPSAVPSALPGLGAEKPAAKAPEQPAPPAPALSAVPDPKTDPKPDKPSGGGEVVRLDRFRKK
ncbi:MAG TPA: ClpXP protease specificity-enhancing factor SspB [Pseudolabrys sp.]|jgi:hypothetical protein